MQATAVLKLGGSLLEPPHIGDLPARLRETVAELGGARPILVVGGGPTVDLVRAWDAWYGLGEETSHWIAVRALTVNAQVVMRLVDRFEVVEDEHGCETAWQRDAVPILDIWSFLREVDAARPDPLPRRWRVTSDSIAARVAAHYGAPRLVLVKSTSPPAGLDVASAAAQGYVDEWFPVAAVGLAEVLALDLRAPAPLPTPLVV